MRLVDANVILRYLLDDDTKLAEKATAILEVEDVHIPFEVVAEVVYVMQGVYHVSRADVAEVLGRILNFPNIATNSKSVMRVALRLYADKNIDFVDAILCSYCRVEGAEIDTFDKKLMKLCSGKS